MDQEFDKVLFLINIRVEPERVNDLAGEPALFSDPHVLEITPPVVIHMESCGFLEIDHIRPPAPPGHKSHILFRTNDAPDRLLIGKREVRHDDQDARHCTGEVLIERIGKSGARYGHLYKLGVEELGAKDHRLAVRVPHRIDHVKEHRFGKSFPLLLVKHAGKPGLGVFRFEGDDCHGHGMFCSAGKEKKVVYRPGRRGYEMKNIKTGISRLIQRTTSSLPELMCGDPDLKRRTCASRAVFPDYHTVCRKDLPGDK